ncbi:chitotriosidase-1 [Aspergillus udagawae]|nr:chitotriosidase-1 [Aspergillus udagawae]
MRAIPARRAAAIRLTRNYADCGKNCVAGCDSKAECDPGFGAEWADASSCPLNVCCSKYGFCGTTAEFCGDKKVNRPSCSKSGSLQRVVGYYETWSTRRRCNKFWPEKIPLGVYTHINVAFAVINPETFEIAPSLNADIDLYRRVTYLKTIDPDLKVFIAIGGWAYNDPGPTATTFSDLAASTEKQKTFFKSLVRFLATYNFDGIDLDWEYPVADDRSGRPEDYKNLPILLKNLKAALKNTGGRDGLSITLPASYWYLQHFDVKQISQHVDFLNVMTYDMHGTWDKGNKWLGAYLNTHTNLTEIKNSMELLWRNDIPPEKVVLGMAFYGRAFTVVDRACTTPGCLFASGAEPGDCSSEVGILMISEIEKVIKEKSLKPTLYKDAAVKVAAWDDQWVGYDDEDTFQLKADFARSQCLGGVMVWAISHDLLDGTYSRALATVANRKWSHWPITSSRTTPSPSSMTNANGRIAEKGALLDGLPFPAVTRIDTTTARSCLMMAVVLWKSSSMCFAVPPTKKSPLVVGTRSTTVAAWAACCTTGTKNMAVHQKCEWGASFLCDRYTCPAQNPNILALSCNGNGGSACGGDWRTNRNEERKYCCDSGDDNMKWDDCTWEDHYSATGLVLVPAGTRSYCASNCPADKVRVAMEHHNTCSRKTGSRAKCCSSKYTTTITPVDPLVTLWEADLTAWLQNPTCSSSSYSDAWLYGSLEKRSTPYGIFSGHPTRGLAMSGQYAPFEKRQDQLILFSSNSIIIILTDIIFAYRSSSIAAKVSREIKVWDKIIGAQYTYLATSQMMPFLMDQWDIYGTAATDLAGDIICNLPKWDEFIKLCTMPVSENVTCANVDRDAWDPEYSVDPDTYGTSSNSAAKRALTPFDKRDGQSRSFTVDCGIDPVTNLRRVMYIDSQPYPNGDGGNSLERANGLTVRFALANPADCTDATIDPNAPNNIWAWVTEHILELQLIPRAIEFMVTGILPPVQGLAEYRSKNNLLPWDIAQLLGLDYSQWAAGITSAAGSPISRIFDSLGSKANPGVLIFNGKQPFGDDTWANVNVPDFSRAPAALDQIRVVISVFEYLNDFNVNSILGRVYSGTSKEWRLFQSTVNKVRPGGKYDTYVLWREFMTNFFGRLTLWVHTWVVDHLNQLEVTWREVYNAAPDAATRASASALLQDIQRMRIPIQNIQFDTSVFFLPN